MTMSRRVLTALLLVLLTVTLAAQQSGTTYGTRFRFTGTGCALSSGSGSPEGATVGSVCDVYVRSDASGSNPALYVKLTGTATNTGWVAVLSSGAAGPTDATYITKTSNSTLTAEQALASLATGLMQVTTTTGAVTSVTTSAGVSGLLSDETGSGAAVFAVSPTLTGTASVEKVSTAVDSAAVTWHQPGVTTLTDAVATTVLTIAMADAARTGGELAFAVEVTDASADNDVYTGSVRFAAQRKGATVTCSVASPGGEVVVKSHAGADLAVTATCDASSGTSIVVKLNADTALTATTFKAHWRLTMLKGHGAIS